MTGDTVLRTRFTEAVTVCARRRKKRRRKRRERRAEVTSGFSKGDLMQLKSAIKD